MRLTEILINTAEKSSTGSSTIDNMLSEAFDTTTGSSSLPVEVKSSQWKNLQNPRVGCHVATTPGLQNPEVAYTKWCSAVASMVPTKRPWRKRIHVCDGRWGDRLSNSALARLGATQEVPWGTQVRPGLIRGSLCVN